MGNTVEALPEGLWSRISNRLYEQGDEAVPVLAPLTSELRPGATTRASRYGSTRLIRRMAVPVGIAAAVAAVLAFQLVGANSRISNLHSALRLGDVRTALTTPGHHLVVLKGSTHQAVATFVVLPDGRGYLVSARLPGLPSTETYQLWGIVAGKAISIGLMGPTPSHVTFTVSGSPGPATLAVTAEPSGGASTPTLPVVASGPV